MDEPSGIGRADGDDLGLLNDSVPEEETHQPQRGVKYQPRATPWVSAVFNSQALKGRDIAAINPKHAFRRNPRYIA